MPKTKSNPRADAAALLQAALSTGVRGELRTQLQAALEIAQRGPRRHATDLEYEAIPNGGHLLDPTRPGFIARKARGVLRWCYRHRDPVTGKQAELTLGYAPQMGLADARAAWERTRAARLAGGSPADAVVDVQPAPAAPVTVRDAVEHYLRRYAEVAKRPRSAREDARLLHKHVLPVIGDMAAVDVTEDDVLRVLAQLNDRLTERARTRAVLSALFSVCSGRTARAAVEPLLPRAHVNPVSAVRVKVERTPAWAPKLELMRAYHQALTSADCPLRQEHRDVLRLQLLTACRIGEVAGLRWAWVDLEAAEIRFPADAMKAHAPHTVFLSAPALALLKRRHDERAATDVFAFPSITDRRKPLRVDLVQHALAQHRAALGVDADFTTHRVRHALTTWAGEAGVPADVVNRTLAHTLDAKRDVLVHYSAVTMDRQARELWARWAEVLS